MFQLSCTPLYQEFNLKYPSTKKHAASSYIRHPITYFNIFFKTLLYATSMYGQVHMYKSFEIYGPDVYNEMYVNALPSINFPKKQCTTNNTQQQQQTNRETWKI